MEYANELKKVINILSKSKKVNSFDKNGDKECSILAHSLLDIRESSKEIIEELLPKLLTNDITEDDIEDILLDIGEELRHILYHIKAPSFFKYLEE